MFRKEDIEQIEQRGSSVKTVEEQVERFKKGFPWLKIVAPATPERGIQVLDEAAVEAAASYYDNATMNGKCKFVPASGAASRMFKDLFSGLDALKAGKELADDAPAAKFVDRSSLSHSILLSCSVSRHASVLNTVSQFLPRPLRMRDSDMERSLRVSSSSISILTARSHSIRRASCGGSELYEERGRHCKSRCDHLS